METNPAEMSNRNGAITAPAKKTVKRRPVPCPVADCGFNANMALYDAATKRPLILQSTRSYESEDGWRDMDGFDENEELARLHRALEEVRPQLSSKKPQSALEQRLRYGKGHQHWRGARPTDARTVEILAFIAEAIDNIDEHLRREGERPLAWSGDVRRR